MRDDLLQRLDEAAKLGLNICREAADRIRRLQSEAMTSAEHKAATRPDALTVASASPEIRAEIDRLTDQIVASLGLEELMAKHGFDVQFATVGSDGRGGALATLELHGTGVGATALLHLAERLRAASVNAV
jgi:hypothetical protein